ncbi:MAG: hypothetical protein UFA98_12465 [Ruminococcus sp.]|nr:hypothetical protein [Ruminococcus sp.]
MKNKHITVLIISCVTVAALSGCGAKTGSTTETAIDTTVQSTTIQSTTVQATSIANTTAEPTTAESSTEPPATAEPATAEPETQEYTAVELAEKSLEEIIDIMGGDYTSEMVQLTYAFSSSGTPYIYNYDVLPGFAFATYDKISYRGISIMDGAKLNGEISSDMNYNEVANIIGDFEVNAVGQQTLTYTTTIDGYNVTFCFLTPNHILPNTWLTEVFQAML